MGHRDPDRAAPHALVVGNEADKEILIHARRLTVLHQEAHDFVAGALRAIPRAVQSDEGVARIFGGKLIRRIEGDAERRRMRLNENVRRRDAVRKVGALAFVARILMVAEIVPGPAIEGARRHVRYIVRRQVVAESIALVDGAPERAGSWLDRKARTIANAGRVDALVLALRIEGEDVGAALLVAERGADRRLGDVGLILARRAFCDVAAGADRNEQRLVIGRESEVARPVSPAARQARNRLGGAGGLHLSAAIGKAHHGVRRRDIDEPRLLP